MTDDDVRRRDLHEPRARDDRTGRSAAAARIQHQSRWVDLQIQQAMERGEFDDLPGAGKPIQGIGDDPDPDWWLKRLIEREQVTGVLPPALALRSEDARLDAELDRLATDAEVRSELAAFNDRVRRARMQLTGGPPVITPLRDVDDAVAAWHERRRARVEAMRVAVQEEATRALAGPRRRWWRRGRGSEAGS